ncbi:glycerate kinase family protein [Geoalkalibacter sp.]|uniref:glycerate kinase family protein n=1 Tax=Geoalkalibacter sp. TaxID=3041440 RepID=UPI00272E0914|nr:glycerate kinase [Geoalkalibacter sp.]
MNLLIAPDSFKESLSSAQAALQIEAGFREIFPDVRCVRIPLADGGEGTVEALVTATAGRIEQVQVSGPLGEPVEAFFGVCGNGRTAVIEMAAASGLALVSPALRNPMKTTTYGTGELIRAALDLGIRHLIIGIGGSATCDGGAGMLQALGAKLRDKDGKDLVQGGAALSHLHSIDLDGLDRRLGECDIEVACDVDNPLTGPKGAAAVFGPQKGATQAMVAQLDAALGHYARVIKDGLGVEVADLPGAGAAGGLGAALMTVLKARLRPGIRVVMEATELDKAILQCDLVITGEGRLDSQSLHGKTPIGVARLAKQLGKPVIVIAGSLSLDASSAKARGIDAAFSMVPGVCTLETALAQAETNLRNLARNLAATLRLGMALR